MEKYLKMSDFVVGKVQLSLNRNFDVCVSYDCADPDMIARKTMDAMEHAINSHDELVAMNKELLAVIERVIGSSEKFDKVMGTSEWADGYKQCAIDTGEALRGILDAMKAKAAS